MSSPALLNVGFYNYVLTDKIVALVSSESAPMRRLVQGLRKEGNLIDATQGRRTKCVIFTTGPTVVLSAISQETLAKRLSHGEPVGSEPIEPDPVETEDAEDDAFADNDVPIRPPAKKGVRYGKS